MVNHIATTLSEALKYLAKEPHKIMAGGTDLMVQHHAWSGTVSTYDQPLLMTRPINELSYIKEVNDSGVDYLCIGANTTLEELLQSEKIPHLFHKVLKEMASINIRHEATIAGNIANASPAGDTLPFLYLMDAIIVVQSLNHMRMIPISKFITGVRKIDLRDHELITEIRFVKRLFTHDTYTKIGGRLANSISKVSFIGMARIDNQIVKDFRIAFGSVSPTIIREPVIERQFQKITIDELKVNKEKIIEQYQTLIRPITDQRSNEMYRRQISINLLSEWIESL